MAGEWVGTSLGNIVDIKHGYAFKGEFFRDEPPGDVLLTPGNFAIGGGFKGDKLKYYVGPVPDEFVLRAGDLLVSMTDLSKQADTLGFPALVPAGSSGRRYLHNQRLGKVVAKDAATLDLRYVHYLLCSRSYRNEVIAGATGTTVKHTSPERIKRFRFRLPPLAEQRAIAGILGALDDKIELNRRMNATLEAIAGALFKSWFVDFDPVRARLALSGAEGAQGRPLCLSKRAGMDAQTAGLFPDSFEDSAFGEIPAGWKDGVLGDVAGLRLQTISPGAFPGETFAHYSIPAYDEGRCPRSESGDSIKSNKTLVPSGCVLVSKLNPRFPRVWMPEVGPDSRAIASTEFLVLVPQHCAPREYVYLLVSSPEFQSVLATLVTGTSSSHQRVQRESLLNIPAVLPSQPVMDRFKEIVHPLLEKVSRNGAESRTLTAIRDALLPKLLAGEIRVAQQ